MKEAYIKYSLSELLKRETKRYEQTMVRLKKAKDELNNREKLIRYGTEEAERLRVRIRVLEDLMEDTTIEEEKNEHMEVDQERNFIR